MVDLLLFIFITIPGMFIVFLLAAGSVAASKEQGDQKKKNSINLKKRRDMKKCNNVALEKGRDTERCNNVVRVRPADVELFREACIKISGITIAKVVYREEFNVFSFYIQVDFPYLFFDLGREYSEILYSKKGSGVPYHTKEDVMTSHVYTIEVRELGNKEEMSVYGIEYTIKMDGKKVCTERKKPLDVLHSLTHPIRWIYEYCAQYPSKEPPR